MYNLDFSKKAHVHFIGIGGISMSGLAKLLINKGIIVSGSDWHASDLTDELKALGAYIVTGENAVSENSDDWDVCVYTSAVHEDNAEFAMAKAKGIPLMSRGELMGQIMKNFKNAVGVSGTNGKTTTTSLLSLMFLDAGLDPTISVGGIVPEIGGNFRIGSGDSFVVESCEYTNSFLSFFPSDVIILNIEEDHLDFFKDIDDIRNSFRSFADLVPNGGYTVVCNEIKEYRKLFSGLNSRLVTYGIFEGGSECMDFNKAVKSDDYVACNVSYDRFGRGSFDIYENGVFLMRAESGLVGRHNVLNTLSAVAIARKYDMPVSSILKTIKRFTGTKRRFEFKGEWHGVKIYDDYAHQPDAIEATLNVFDSYECKRVITVFQPHTYSRTKQMLDEFAKALSLSDVVIMAKIYAAREIDDGTISSDDVRKKLEKLGTEAYYFETFEEIQNFLKKFSTEGDLLITMGAGDVVNIGDALLKE